MIQPENRSLGNTGALSVPIVGQSIVRIYALPRSFFRLSWRQQLRQDPWLMLTILTACAASVREEFRRTTSLQMPAQKYEPPSD